MAAPAPVKKNSRHTETGPMDATPIVKPSQHAGTRRSARLAKDSGQSPICPAPQPRPVPVSPTPPPAPISQPTDSKRKRLPEGGEAEDDAQLEGVRPSKQPQEFPPSKDQLSEKNLRRFNKETMDPMNDPQQSSIKRSLSRRTTTAASEVTQETTQTPRSSGTTAYYRYTHLSNAEVYIHTKVPDDIQKAVDAIVKAKPSDERLAQLKAISQVLHNDCVKAVQAAIGEDDCVNLFQDALKALDHDNICLRAKSDWREELKPKIQRPGLNFDFLDHVNFTAGDQQQELRDTSSPPRKRQQQLTDQSYISPRTSLTNEADSTPTNQPVEPNTMPPPATPATPAKERARSLIKTPRPDISVGTQRMNLISALSSQGLDNNRVKQFIAALQQKEMVYREPNGPQEPMLISLPALRGSDLVFPFAVVEAKAYSTGKQIFEAENQAAVSGACGLKIQLCLDELVKKSAPISSDFEPIASKDPAPLFFSVCTQGPYYELWVHWTEVEGALRKFNQALLEICHGVLLKTVADFIIAVDNVLRWGTGPFLDSVVDRLAKVARKAGA